MKEPRVERIHYTDPNRLNEEVITVARPPKLYFLARYAKSWKVVQQYLNNIVFHDAKTPATEKECHIALRRYALSVYLQFHPSTA